MVEGTLYSFLIQGASIAMVFAGNLLLARWAGSDSYGVYVHIFNWVSILSVAVTGGRDDLVLTEIPRYHATGQSGQIAWLVKRTNSHVLIASFVIGFVFLVIIGIFPIPTLHEYRLDLILAWGAVYFSAFLILNQSILQSLNFIRLCQVVDRLLRPGLLALLFASALLLRLSVNNRLLIILAEVNLGVCAIVLARIMWIRMRPYFQSHGGTRGGISGGTTGGASSGGMTGGARLTRKTFNFFLITLMTLLVTKITMLMLPYFAPRSEIGIFNISYRFADLIVYPFFLMHTMLPQLFARHATAEKAYQQSLYRSATQLMTILCLPLLLVNLLAGKFLLGLFGRDFQAGYVSLLLLSLSQFFYSLFGPANTILMMQNRERESVICLLIYVSLLIAASRWLIPVWGITGGAAAMLITCLIYNIFLAVYAYRLSGVISPFFAWLVRRTD